jgi:hypothetical protein
MTPDLQLIEALYAAWREVEEELQSTPLQHWNESVFRFFITRGILRATNWQVQTEWKKIDLILQQGPVMRL